MKSLAYKPKDTDNAVVSSPSGSDKERFPSISLNGPQAKAAGISDCEYGAEYEMTVRVKVTRIGGWENGDDAPPVELDVLSAGNVKEAEASEDDDDSQAEEEPKKKAPRVKSPRDSGFKDAY